MSMTREEAAHILEYSRIVSENFTQEAVTATYVMALAALRGPTREQVEKMRGSMTNREAALKSCKDRLKHLENAPSHHCGKRQRQRAIELEKVKIEALRPITKEQIEKMWKGEWIGMTDDECTWYECSRCEHDLYSWEDPNHFCPSCGAPMTDKAVEMVMERLEALKDEAETN